MKKTESLHAYVCLMSLCLCTPDRSGCVHVDEVSLLFAMLLPQYGEVLLLCDDLKTAGRLVLPSCLFFCFPGGGGTSVRQSV